MPEITRIDKPQNVHLKEISPRAPGSLERDECERETNNLGEELEELLDLLFYAGKNSLLIILQGMDTSGKDGTIRHLLNHSNAQSCQVAPFKVPTPDELSHDFLWRCHQKAPGKGSITIFNRSHYEDVLVVRVHDLVPESIWSKRYDRINDFEKLLTQNSTIVVKFYLHIDQDEQEKRLKEREQDVEKAWKLNVGDWKERAYWDKYQEAYEQAIGKCADEDSPWYIIPANAKWYRNYLITKILIDTLKQHQNSWLEGLAAVGVKAQAELEAYRRTNAP